MATEQITERRKHPKGVQPNVLRVLRERIQWAAHRRQPVADVQAVHRVRDISGYKQRFGRSAEPKAEAFLC